MPVLLAANSGFPNRSRTCLPSSRTPGTSKRSRRRSLGFRILSPKPIDLRPGARIRYRLRWHGLALRWLTEIQSWNPPNEFVDVQAQGPYRLWHHTHRFEPVDGGTLMRDMVRYVLPFGLLGRLAHAWVVKSDLEAIFDYRARKVSEILGSRCAHE